MLYCSVLKIFKLYKTKRYWYLSSRSNIFTERKWRKLEKAGQKRHNKC